MSASNVIIDGTRYVPEDCALTDASRNSDFAEVLKALASSYYTNLSCHYYESEGFECDCGACDMRRLIEHLVGKQPAGPNARVDALLKRMAKRQKG